MAFRTENRFYVLDRNGTVVKPFSIKIPASEPIQPLAVFDYDQRRDYRFLLAQGNTVQMFNSKGKKVTGFKFKKTKTPIINAPVHIRIDKKDYIAIQEESGKLNLLNRVGNSRIKVKETIPFSGNKVSSYLKTFSTSDTGGNLIQIDTKGNIIKTDLELATGHKITTTTKSLVTLSENNLNIKGIPVTLPFGRYSEPRIFYINNVIYVTTTDLDAQKVYLFFSNGTPVSGFPVYGTSAADLVNADDDKAVELVVQSETNGMLIYEIN
jgi:DNA-binding beta-propeller fold protein YncE